MGVYGIVENEMEIPVVYSRVFAFILNLKSPALPLHPLASFARPRWSRPASMTSASPAVHT